MCGGYEEKDGSDAIIGCWAEQQLNHHGNGLIIGGSW
jgi:hypothetical protein